MNLKELQNRSILLFGKSRSFSDNEFESQMKFHKIKVVREFSDDVALIVDGRMMSPYEQNLSDELYEKKVAPNISIDILEKELVGQIDKDTLLMSLKLSHDKDRLKSFIQNRMIDDELFFRLLKMYSWGDEDFFENDGNRDVSAAYILRFYENIERNHNVQFATTGFIHLVSQTKSSKLLKEISTLKPLQFHPKIKAAIAMSIYCDEDMQKKFFKLQDEKILEALSFNKQLNTILVKEFLEDENLGSNVARSVTLNDELFELLQIYPKNLALNESLTTDMQEKLLAFDDRDITYALALNDNLNKKILHTLLALNNEEIELAIYENSSAPVEILNAAYADSKNHMALAKNESTPIEILYQLQLDSRYERAVKTNAGFGKHIQTQNIGWL